VKLTAGTFICGFGSCKWQNKVQGAKEDESALATKILYTLGSSDDRVLYEGKLQKLLEVVNAKRLQQPGCKLAFHDIQPCA
jgi:hypothetical protein